MHSILAEPLALPCGARLPNRLAKAAMTEGLARPDGFSNARHERLYRRWSQGGAGLLVTGNVMVDRRSLERPGNLIVDPAADFGPGHPGFEALKRLAAAGTVGGNHLWMQIGHPGRQSPWYATTAPRGPSAVRLDLLGHYRRPKALTETEILDLVQRFAAVARVARESGFTGVQVHAAHGYLVSSFLSPVTNRRTDAWGGSLAGRARFLIEILRATRRAVGADFPVSVKLNSDDFRRGGFSLDDCLEVVRLLNAESVDVLEVSGGTYEQPRLLGAEGRTDTASDRSSPPGAARPASTQAREAYFLASARAIRAVADMPVMMPGGFRRRATMESALLEGEIDVVGLGRPLCTHPDLPRDLIAGRLDDAPAYERRLDGGPGGRLATRMARVLGQMGWYYAHIEDLADGRRLDLERSLPAAFGRYMAREQVRALHRAVTGAGRAPSTALAPRQ